MIRTMLDFDESDYIENKIREMREKRKWLGEEIDKLKIRYPRCPHCEKRYFVSKYTFNAIPFLYRAGTPCEPYIGVRCPLGHTFRLPLDEEIKDAAKFDDEKDFMDIIGEKIEDLDYGYCD